MGTFEAGRQQRSDAELLAAHIAGDRYAFEELFYRHHRQLYRLARITSRRIARINPRRLAYWTVTVPVMPR